MEKITLATLSKATAQEVFTQVATHLLTQNAKSQSGVVGCQYHLGGLSCAAGCLISEKEYKSNFEGDSWEQLLEKNWVPDEHSTLIIMLQKVHDAYLVTEWPEMLVAIAKKFKLEMPVV